MLAIELGNVWECPRSSWFWNKEGVLESSRGLELWQSGETTDEVTVLITLEAQGVKRPLREAEAWYHMVWSFSEENPVEHIVKGTIQL